MINEDFKPLNWNDIKSMDGHINRIKSSISIDIGNRCILNTLFNIFKDNDGIIWLNITGDFESDKPNQLYPVGTFENGKDIANRIYQKNMNEIYNKINKLISSK